MKQTDSVCPKSRSPLSLEQASEKFEQDRQQLNSSKPEKHSNPASDLIRECYLQATGRAQSAVISGVQAYVLNDQLQLVPMGVNGELYLAGPELNNGYLEQSGLTTTHLIANPLTQHTKDKWLYRTGKQVRWLPNGELEYLGFKDLQVSKNSDLTHCL
ncbi:amino acid adenylation domain-containing protein [Xenorhabdus sp. Reich]|uniref:Amino acid adenylation domain-containing protein n=1 Tax=Xenorhabdus littoralis TaxID=2582835 RepID=A0ABU4SI00_9GAMM|nr:amino acid adenylation domain-containing protein [Xenorhabdus sp. Reich]